jgi:hypothetical protein
MSGFQHIKDQKSDIAESKSANIAVVNSKFHFLILEHKKKDRLAAASPGPINCVDQATRLNASRAA